MSIAKVIEVIAESEDGWDEAARKAVADASESVRGLRSLYVENMSAEIQGGQIVMYRLNAKITFVIED